MLPCGNHFPLVFIRTYWGNDPTVLIKIKGKKEQAEEEEEEGVREVCEEMEG